MPSPTQITLYGNLGADPQTLTFEGKQRTGQRYDAIIDEVVENCFTTPDRELITFSIAVNQRDPEGNDVTRWIRCDDWKGLTANLRLRKGDRVRVRGELRERSVTRNGETRTYRNLSLEEVQVERRKIRHQAA